MSFNLQGSNGFQVNLVSGLFAVGGTTSLFSSVTNTLSYVLAGQFRTKGPTANIPFTIEPNSGILPTAPNSFQNVAVGDAAGFSIFIDSGGNFTVAQGPSVPAGQKVTFPPAPANKVIVGGFKVVPTATYTPGTTSLTSISTFYNFACHPGEAL
jgi:hypothetical protein